MEMIQIESINCRGLRDKMKRLDIFDRAQKDKIKLLCLQETHIIENDLNTLKLEWNIEFVILGKETNSGGVMIAIDNNFEHKIHEINVSQEGRHAIIDIEIPDVARFLLINVYVPNDDSPLFFENVF